MLANDRGMHRGVTRQARQLSTHEFRGKQCVFNCRETRRHHAPHQTVGSDRQPFSLGGWVGAENGATPLNFIVEPMDVRAAARAVLIRAILGESRLGGRRLGRDSAEYVMSFETTRA